MGCSGGGKITLIKRKEIKDMNYTAGCHKAYPTGNVILETSNEIKTLRWASGWKGITFKRFSRYKIT